jgi:hypothetical protein
VRHIERYSASETKRGRPATFDRSFLLEVSRQLKALLERETQHRISLKTFIGFYLPILNYPEDLVGALGRGEITKFEASLLSRLTPAQLQVTPGKALKIRQEVLQRHLKTRGSQNTLRVRVNEVLYGDAVVTSENMTAAVEKINELLRIDESDSRHLFYEQMKELFFALRDIQPEELDDKTLEEVLNASGELMAVIYKIRQRRAKKSEAPVESE